MSAKASKLREAIRNKLGLVSPAEFFARALVLKPCPFCGGQASFSREAWEGSSIARTIPEDEAGCIACNVWMPVERWNARHVETCQIVFVDDSDVWGEFGEWRCSECGTNRVERHDNFCPNCGRRVKR